MQAVCTVWLLLLIVLMALLLRGAVDAQVSC
jgi:hypothetical protein